MKQKVIVFLSFATLAIASFSSVYAAGSIYKTFTALGVGDVSVALPGCADITCPTGHQCFCAEGTFPLKSPAAVGIGAGNIHIEMLMDNSTQTQVVGGVCDNSSGQAFFTSAKGGNTLRFGLAGTWCTTDPTNPGPAVVNGGFNILPGTGTFSRASGSGSFSFGGPEQDLPVTAPEQLQLTGNFSKAALPAAPLLAAPSGVRPNFQSEAR